MNEQFRAEHLARRKQLCEEIRSNYDLFKVCCQCLSISYRMASVCSICHAYRFVTEPLAIEVVLTKMVESPYPFTSGTVPRLTRPPAAVAEKEGVAHG